MKSITIQSGQKCFRRFLASLLILAGLAIAGYAPASAWEGAPKILDAHSVASATSGMSMCHHAGHMTASCCADMKNPVVSHWHHADKARGCDDHCRVQGCMSSAEITVPEALSFRRSVYYAPVLFDSERPILVHQIALTPDLQPPRRTI